jgi:transcriptional regulator with XRE-family HTH domain
MSIKEMSDQDKKILRSRIKERRLFLNMTYQDLADKTGISKSTLQRYETGGIKNLPYDKIFVLSDALEVSPDYFTNLSYDYSINDNDSKGLYVKEERSEYLSNISKFEKKALEHITPSLISQGYKVVQQDRGSLGDLVATKGSESWHIDFLYLRDVNKYPTGIGMGNQQFLLRLGRLSVYTKPVTKYSIVFDRRVIAEDFIQRYKPIHLNVELSFLLLTDKGYEELKFYPE